ncbi:hypothetical protein NWF34_16700 [Gordonia sp. GONU]|uniref:hypothetical protein n=1 Tax=Gordonia sp. GONU TaxID=2972949 RepID=UPI0021ACCF0C|nr:hypothetical protein [Gordonia sp. GONU]MCR8898588.1 hypothetical protein [Gordonia sp. GONU]
MNTRALHPLDETLMHQVPWPFGFAGTSDPRFYDRYWFAGVDPAGDAGFISGMALYKNIGVCDGYGAVQRGGRQYNSRWSRPLTTATAQSAVGDLAVEILEPYRTVRVTWSGDSTPLAADLVFTSAFDPYTEEHYLDASTGRVTQEITRYNQIGRWDGWLSIDGARIGVDDWWAVRDHSWGVRPGVGGIDRSVADPAARSSAPMMHTVLYAATADFCVCVSRRENQRGTVTYLDGEVIGVDGRHSTVVIADVTTEFVSGTRTYRSVRLEVETDAGARHEIVATPLLEPWAYAGTGYDGGYRDGRGLGVPRGDLVEHDVYELVPPEAVLLDGDPTPSGHREQFAKIVVDGVTTTGYCTVMARGSLPHRGIG